MRKTIGVSAVNSINNAKILYPIPDANFSQVLLPHGAVSLASTHMDVTTLLCCHSWVGLTTRMRRACGVVCLWPPTLGGADQTSCIARSIAIGKRELEAAFDQCQNTYECVCIYTHPPPGRSTFMINMSRPYGPLEDASNYRY